MVVAWAVGVFGGVLLSHSLSGAVPSALEGLASGFGMGPGVSRSAMAAVTLWKTVCFRFYLPRCGVLFVRDRVACPAGGWCVDRIVDVS